VNELYADVFERCYGLSTIGLRYFNVFGSRQDPEGPYAAVIPCWARAMLSSQQCTINGDGESSRDFCFVANAVQINLRAALANRVDALNQVYNVAVGGRTTLNELHSLLAQAIQERRPGLAIPPPDMRLSVPAMYVIRKPISARRAACSTTRQPTMCAKDSAKRWVGTSSASLLRVRLLRLEIVPPPAMASNEMQSRLPRWMLVLVSVLLVLAMETAAGQKRAAIEQIKASVVGVGTFQRTRTPQFRFLGTGFVVDDGRSIATNAHVIAAVLDGGAADAEILAVLLPGGDTHSSTVVEVRRTALDDEHDLALLQLKTGKLPALTLRADDGVKDGDEFLFTGFPIGAVLGPFAATHRAMIACITPIIIPPATSDRLDSRSVRRLQRGAFPVYQLDGTAYPGNSGSPLYDGVSGEVVGVVNMVFVKGLKENALAQPSGISYAIPVRHLRDLVAKAH
jgi:hypothetical protein